MSIPVLACPVLNRADLTLRMIRSIDYPVDRLVVVNNGDDPGICGLLEQLQTEADFNLRIHKPGVNLGVAASWNWVISTYPAYIHTGEDLDYWLFVGNDIQFSPGDLAKIDRFVREHPDYVIMPANWGHSLFAVTPACIEQIGWFDENLYPAYCEDCDQMHRIHLSGAPWSDVPGIKSVHGEPPGWGSSTVWSDKVLLEKCKITQANNHRYYTQKWGNLPGKEVFIHPYNDPELTVKDWFIDPFLAQANENPLAGLIAPSRMQQ